MQPTAVHEEWPEILMPRHLHEAWQWKNKLGERAVYGGGVTLLRTQWENQTMPVPAHLIALDRLKSLRGIRLRTGGVLEIGAMSTLSECMADSVLQSSAPLLAEALQWIGAPAVRNRATLGGNIASRIGDVLPALLVTNAELSVYSGRRLTRLPLRSWLEASVARRPGELLCRIHLPLAATGAAAQGTDIPFFTKVGRREAFTPSLVTVAFAGRLDENGTLRGIQLAVGGGTAKAHHLTAAESLLEGRRLEMTLLPPVASAIREEYVAASDVFAGDAYRRETAANLVTAHLWQLCRL